MSSPWNKIQIPEAKNLQEIMEEELSEILQETKGKKSKTIEREPSISDDDFEMIQFCDIECEEDSDDDQSISSEHGNSEIESDDYENIEDKMYWDKYDTVMKKFDPAPGGTARNIDNQPCRTITGVDTKTSNILQEMMDRGIFDKITGTIARGKQAAVLLATKSSGKPGRVPPGKYAIKAFRRNAYGVDNCGSSKKLPGKTAKSEFVKAQKEMEYLQKLTHAGVPCPEVVWRNKNILVMSYIGKVYPAPTLKYAKLSPMKAQIAFEQIMEYTKTLFNDCDLVHTKLTEDSILWSDGCYIIGLSSAIETHEKNAFHILYRNIQKICKFFDPLDVPNFISPQSFFTHVTGCDYFNRVQLAELEKYIEYKRFPNRF